MGNRKDYTFEVKSGTEIMSCSQIAVSSDFATGYPSVTLTLNDKNTIAGMMKSVSSGKMWSTLLSVTITAAQAVIFEASDLAVYRILPVETRDGYSASAYAMSGDILKLIAYPGSLFCTDSKMTVKTAIGKIMTAAGLSAFESIEDVSVGDMRCLVPVKFTGMNYLDMVREVVKVYGVRVFVSRGSKSISLKFYDPIMASSTEKTYGKVHLTDSSLSLDGMAAI